MRRRGAFFGLMLLAASTLMQFGIAPAGARGATAQQVPGVRFLEDIVCLPGGICLGVGFTVERKGAVVVLRATGSVEKVHPVPGTTSLSSIACRTDGGCIAVGDTATRPVVVEVTSNGAPGAVRPVRGADELYKVACPTATTCLATGGRITEPVPGHPEVSARFVVIRNGRPAPAQRFSPEARRFFGIACPTSIRCLAVGGGNVAVLWKGRTGEWTSKVSKLTVPDGSGSPGEAISCPSPTRCFTTASSTVRVDGGTMGVPAIMALSPEGVAGPVQALSSRPGTLQDISCVAVGTTCTVAGQDVATSQGMTIDVAGGGPTALTFWTNSNFFTGVSCVAAASCGVVGSFPQTAVFGWHGPIPS